MLDDDVLVERPQLLQIVLPGHQLLPGLPQHLRHVGRQVRHGQEGEEVGEEEIEDPAFREVGPLEVPAG